jgi:hypothetical protein
MSTSSIKSIFTAVTLSTQEEDYDGQSMILQPLLPQDDEQQPQQPTDGTIVIISKQKQQEQEQELHLKTYNIRFVVLGVLTGFFIQVISLGAYAVLLCQYHSRRHDAAVINAGGDDISALDVTTWWPAMQKMNQGVVGAMDDTSDTNNYLFVVFNINWFIYGILSVLTQIDLVIYVLIWITFTCTMTKNGMKFLRLQAQNPSLQRRWVFVLGVYFLVGIVLGAFGAWSMIDIYLGFPIPFLPIVATVGIDLLLCYLMVWCYDLGRRGARTTSTSLTDNSQDSDDDDDDDDDDDQAGVCC